MEMPFGKHEGEDIEDLPTGYIVWCLNMLTARDDLDEKIFQDMDYELKNETYMRYHLAKNISGASLRAILELFSEEKIRCPFSKMT
jgi:hypothetical protein